MPAVFRAESFPLPEELLPEHIEDSPSRHTDNDYVREDGKYHIEGFVPEDGDFFWLAINLDDEQVAKRMLLAAIELRTSGYFGIALVGPNDEGIYSSASHIV